MNAEKLSKRLEAVASFIKPGSRIADIGSDHAYLPCYTILKGIAKYAVAGEVAEGPFISATKQVQNYSFMDQIDVRKGDGLEVVRKSDQIDTIVIAGMGGFLIRSILEKGSQQLSHVKRLILQPNVGAWQIRQWAENHFFQITAESILKEDRQIYEIMVLKRVEENVTYNEKERLFGPILLKEKSAIFKEKWQHEKMNWERILKNVVSAKNQSKENKEKIQELITKIQLAEEVLQ